MGYSVWFSDCIKVIEILKEKLPKMETFNSIEGNAFGDFVVKTDTEEYVVKHNDFSVWQLKDGWKNPKWVEVE